MQIALAVAAMLTIAFAKSVLAQGSSFGERSNTASTSAQRLPSLLAQELRQRIENEGYKEPEIVPGSFLIRAKDKGGNPVSLAITPVTVRLARPALSNSHKSSKQTFLTLKITVVTETPPNSTESTAGSTAITNSYAATNCSCKPHPSTGRGAN